MSAAKDEPFSALLPFMWRDVELPITEITGSLAHDLVLHQYWGVDGARVESTGLAPMRFHVSIPMTSGISPGKNEKWKDLFPTAFRKFLAAFADKSEGYMQHPELGKVLCKAEHLDFRLSGDRRGGSEVTASFVETLPADADIEGSTTLLDSLIAGPRALQAAAVSLDASTRDLKSIVPKLPKYETSFADFARGLQAIGDQATLLSARTAGKLDALVYRVENVADAIDRAGSAQTWPATNAIERIKSDAYRFKENILKAAGRDVIFYTVPGDTTLGGLLAQIDAKLGDVIALNPALVSVAEIKTGTVVRYYKPRLAAA